MAASVVLDVQGPQHEIAGQILGWSDAFRHLVETGAHLGWSHAYLLESEHPDGAGFYARALAKAINCQGPADPAAAPGSPTPSGSPTPPGSPTSALAPAAPDGASAAPAAGPSGATAKPARSRAKKATKPGSAPAPAPTGRPCLVCEPCRRAAIGGFPALHEIWPSGMAISIEQVQELIGLASARFAPGVTKVFVLHAAERMLLPAASALLKTLEDPPDRTVFVLATGSAMQVLPTIRSRCRLVRLGMPDDASLAAHLGLDEHLSQVVGMALAVAGRHPAALIDLLERRKELSAWTPPAGLDAVVPVFTKSVKEEKGSTAATPVHAALAGGWYPLHLTSALSAELDRIGQKVEPGTGPTAAGRLASLGAAAALVRLQDAVEEAAEKHAAARLKALKEEFSGGYVHPQLRDGKVSSAIGRLHAAMVIQAIQNILRRSGRLAVGTATPDPALGALPCIARLGVDRIATLVRRLELMRAYVRQNVSIPYIFDELFLGLGEGLAGQMLPDAPAANDPSASAMEVP